MSQTTNIINNLKSISDAMNNPALKELVAQWDNIVSRVNQWARESVPDEYNYNSRATYWGSALTAGIINKEEYDLGCARYGNLWDYVGD